MTGRLLDAEEAMSLGLVNHLVEAKDIVVKAREVAELFAAKPSVAWKRTKARFREIALAVFDDAFRAGVLGPQEAYAKGELQTMIDAFMSKKKWRSAGPAGLSQSKWPRIFSNGVNRGLEHGDR